MELQSNKKLMAEQSENLVDIIDDEALYEALEADLNAIADRVFREKGYDPEEAFDLFMKRLDEITEESLNAIDAAADGLFKDTEELMDSFEEDYEDEAHRVERHARTHFVKADKLESVTVKAADKTSDAAKAVAKQYIKAVLSSTSAATAAAFASAVKKKLVVPKRKSGMAKWKNQVLAQFKDKKKETRSSVL